MIIVRHILSLKECILQCVQHKGNIERLREQQGSGAEVVSK